MVAIGACSGSSQPSEADGGTPDQAPHDSTAETTIASPDAGAVSVIGRVIVPPALNGTSITLGVRREAVTTGEEEIVPGRLIVVWRNGGGDPASLSDWPGLHTYRFRYRAHAGPSMITVDVLDASDPRRSIGPGETKEVARRLTGHPALRRVDVDRVHRRRHVPNDPRFGETWGIRHVNVPAGWDLSTGSPEVVVAVLDDGVKDHPDLAGRLLPGWDMIDDKHTAMDGDGRDPDPSPVPHTENGGRSAWHGEHVAGIIASVADDGTGIAGVAPGCKILPVRVLGKEGASVASDTIAGLYWAAGMSVPGVPANPNPAQVINLSLGGAGTSEVEQQAVDDVVAAGITIVAAAGNESHDVAGTAWGSYAGVISVGAVDRQGRRSSYSNWGARIDVMAPGGDLSADLDGDGALDGVLSTSFDETGELPDYRLRQGTSMAAPHVSGVVALMKSANPKLGPGQISQILRETAVRASQCAEGCGAGLVDAAAALMRARGLQEWPQAPQLEVGAERLHVNVGGPGLALSNAGGGTLTWSISLNGDAAAALRAEPSSGTIAAKSSTSVTLTAPAGQPDGTHVVVMTVSSDGGSRIVPISFITGHPRQTDIGPVWVYAYDGSSNGAEAGRTPVSASTGYTFIMHARPGRWYLGAAVDANRNGVLDTGDWWTLYPTAAKRTALELTSEWPAGPYELTLEPFR